MKSWNRLCSLVVFLLVQDVHAQVPYCQDTVPKDTIDFTGLNAGTTWYSNSIVRFGSCCSSVPPDRCLDFILLTDSGTTAVGFNLVSGAVPPGALFYRVDCGLAIPISDLYPVPVPGIHYLTFCKPGNNTNTYSVISLDTNLHYISGKIYLDTNLNCIMDSGETPVRYFPVSLVENGAEAESAFSDLNGDYFFITSTSADTVEITNIQAASRGYNVTCPASGQISISLFPSVDNDFALNCSPGFDLDAGLSGIRFRPGLPGHLYPYLVNNSCIPVSGQAKLILDDPDIQYVSASIAPDQVSGDTLVWSFFNITSQQPFPNFYVTILTDSAAMIGDSVCATFIVEPLSGDVNPANNTITVCFPIRNSFDPNEKQATPHGVGSSGNILPNTELTYTVLFQNTGNDTAYRVIIIDTLNSNLDASTFYPLASSHTFLAERTGNVVTFSFHNINLVDSITNEPHSHGWITFRVTPKPGLLTGSTITNRVSIYFDSNSPILTNSTLHTISILTNVPELHKDNPLRLFPNPVMGGNLFVASNFITGPVQFDIFDASGRNVRSVSAAGTSGTQEINIEGLSSGMYILKASTNYHFSEKRRFVIMR